MLVYKFFQEKKEKMLYSTIAYMIVLFLPTVILNSSLWAQSDSIYTAFILFSLVFLIDKKYIESFILLGISFAFKLQFVFILPLYLLIYLSRYKKEDRIPFYYLFIIPLTNFILCLPAILFGKDIIACLNIYFKQTTSYSKYISLNFPGLYSLIFSSSEPLIQSPGKIVIIVAVAITAILFGMIAFIVIIKKIKFDKYRILEFGLWSVLIATFFLPCMHERYIYVADILSVLYFLVNRDIKKSYLPIGVNFISSCVYMNALSMSTDHNDINIKFLAVIYFIIIIKFSYSILKPIFKKTEGNVERIIT
jgi:Gpi18-like mannosyltransferase